MVARENVQDCSKKIVSHKCYTWLHWGSWAACCSRIFATSWAKSFCGKWKTQTILVNDLRLCSAINMYVYIYIYYLRVCVSVCIHFTYIYIWYIHTYIHTYIQYSTVQYSTAQHSTAQHSTAQHSTVQYSTVQYIYMYIYMQYFVRSQFSKPFFGRHLKESKRAKIPWSTLFGGFRWSCHQPAFWVSRGEPPSDLVAEGKWTSFASLKIVEWLPVGTSYTQHMQEHAARKRLRICKVFWKTVVPFKNGNAI